MTRKPKDDGGGVSIKEYLERILDERSKRYEDRFLDAQKALDTAFAASEKAIAEAKESQKRNASQVSVTISYIIAVLGMLISIYLKFG